MAIKEAGIWPCTITSANFGDNDRGVSQVQINGRIDDGPSKGMMFTYEDGTDARAVLYTGRSCKAVGWKGRSFSTLKADVNAWIAATGGKSTVEIRHLEMKKGKKYDEWCAGGCIGPAPIWDKVNSIGRGAKPLTAPKAENVADADEAWARAMADEGSAPADMPPPDNNHVPAAADDDIPF